MATELSLATMDELTDEIRSRTKGYVLAMLLPPGNGEGSDRDSLKYRWAGGSVQALGLVVLMKKVLSEGENLESDEGDDGE